MTPCETNSIPRLESLDRMYRKFRVGRGRVSGAYERGEVKRIIAVLIALIPPLEDAYTHTQPYTLIILFLCLAPSTTFSSLFL
jgi:hypothetical protein